MIKSIKKYNIFIFIGLFCIIYNPPILPINSMHVVGTISIIYLIVSNKRFPKIVCSRSAFQMARDFLFLFLYLVFCAIRATNGNLAIVYFPIYFLLDIIPFGLMIKSYSDKNNINVNDFINLVLGCGILQALLAITASLIPSLKTFLISFFMQYGYADVYELLASYRMNGFAGGLNFSTPIFQSVLSVIMLVHYKNKSKIYILGALLLFISGIINARTSFVVILIGFVVIILLSKLSLKYKVSFLVGTPLIVLVVINIVIPLLLFLVPDTIEWAVAGLEELIEFFKGNTNEGYFSYVSDIEKYALPEETIAVLFGEGFSVLGGNNVYGYASDIGFINDIWIGGIVYVIVLYSYFGHKMWKFSQNENETISFIGIFGIVCYLIINIKGPIFNMNDLSNFIFLLYIMEFIPSCTYRKNVTLKG